MRDGAQTCWQILDAEGLSRLPRRDDGHRGPAARLDRLLALKLSRYEHATPETLWRDFLDATGTLHIDETSVTCALNLRSHHPALIDAGFAELETPIPWWDGRTLRFRFPPR